MTDTLPNHHRVHRRRIALSALTLFLVATAALLAYTEVLRDDVVLATLTTAGGDLPVLPHTYDGPTGGAAGGTTAASERAEGARTSTGDANDNGSSPDRHTGGTRPSVDDSGTGVGDGAGSNGGATSTDESTPTGSDAQPVDHAPTALQVDGFAIAAADNMLPGDERASIVTITGANDSPVRTAMSFSGIDSASCFAYRVERLDPADVLVGDRSPGDPVTVELGAWSPGQQVQLRVAMRMRSECTIGSGLSSEGSTALAARHPAHATARVDVRFLAGGG